MRTGINAIENALKTGGGSGSSGPTGRYLSYLILGDAESKVIRFLTDMDELAVTNFYEFIVDKNGKFQNFVCAPDFYASDPSWQGEDWVRKFGGKSKVFGTNDLEDPKPRERIVGIAVEREEIPTDVDGRRVLHTQDKLIQIEGREGKKHDARNYLIVKQAKAFWNTVVGYYHEFGTICDRDYKITRSGTGRDVVYSIIPKTPDANWKHDGTSLKELQALYGYGTGLDMDGAVITPESEDRFLYITQTLGDWLKNQASEDRARAALVNDGETFTADTTAPPAWATTAADEPNAAPAASGTDVSSLRARLERHR